MQTRNCCLAKSDSEARVIFVETIILTIVRCSIYYVMATVNVNVICGLVHSIAYQHYWSRHLLYRLIGRVIGMDQTGPEFHKGIKKGNWMRRDREQRRLASCITIQCKLCVCGSEQGSVFNPRHGGTGNISATHPPMLWS